MQTFPLLAKDPFDFTINDEDLNEANTQLRTLLSTTNGH